MPKHPERKAERRAMPEAAATPPLPPFQDPHGLVGSKDGSLETRTGSILATTKAASRLPSPACRKCPVSMLRRVTTPSNGARSFA